MDITKGAELESYTSSISGSWEYGDTARFRFETKDNDYYDGGFDGEAEFYFDGERKPSS